MPDGQFLTSLTVDSRQKPLIAFDSAPPVGFGLNIDWCRRREIQRLTLIEVETYTRRRDGGQTNVLTWRDERGVIYKSGLRGALQKHRPPVLNFTDPPALGYRLERNALGEPVARPLTLAKVDPYTRKTDGGASFLLTWRDDEGALYRSGLRGPYPRRLIRDADY